jgi:hypothetical protein
MRKRVRPSSGDTDPAPDRDWLDLERIAMVEVSSEDSAYPIESALLPEVGGGRRGWRAAEPGTQVVRIVFDEPQRIRRIWMHVVESTGDRTQEFVLRWSADVGGTLRDVVRQQWHFSAPDAMAEIEDYRVDLKGVRTLELAITPDIGGRPVPASLLQFRLA